MNKELIKRILTSIIIAFLSFYCIFLGSYLYNLFIFIILCISFFEWYNLCSKNISFTLILGIIFLTFSVISAYILRNNDLSFFLFTIIISVFSDIGGFVFGKTFKGPKLTVISPNKTYSGSIGSFILSIISGYLYVNYIDLSFNNSLSINFIEFSLIIIFLSTINQIGDLIISCYKRLKKIKNTGKILPGHGGLLDRIDGLIFTIPTSHIIYLILR
jgi:phosphatidate cytidylyltransferase